MPGLGLHSYWRLVHHFLSPDRVLRASKKELLRVVGIQERHIAGLFGAGVNPHAEAEREIERSASAGVMITGFDDPSYPPMLKQLSDPPPVLFSRGRKELFTRPTVAMVGSRAATSYGKRTAFSLARDLSQLSFTVVSGLALGIDTESHVGGLQGVGSTVAVLGCGLDVVYPRQNKKLFQEIAEQGVLVSEYPLGTRPEGFRFPARNRIIAGLSKGVVVVEAARRSGSLITAQMALDYNREVFAVPGQVDSFKSEGAHYLLQQGAKLVQKVDDIVVEFGVVAGVLHGESAEAETDTSHLDPEALTLLQYIDTYPQAREALFKRTGLSAARVSELLLFLELDGLIEMLPGDKLRKI